MNKEIVQIEFRYNVVPKSDYHSDCNTKTITIGIYDTLKEAVDEGNKVIDKIADRFNIKDRLSVNTYGTPNRIVCNWSGKVKVFVTINALHYDDLEETIDHVIKEQEKYNKFMDE